MPITSPDSIYYADGTTLASLETITAAMANSVQTALNKRQAKSFVWADSTARNAQTGMTEGDIGLQSDTAVYYIYQGTSWLVWAKAPTAYTPTITGPATSATSFSYSIEGGRVHVTGYMTFSGASTAALTLTTPTGYNINTGIIAASIAAQIGTGGLNIGSTRYQLGVNVSSATAVALTANLYNPTASGTASYITMVAATGALPGTIASGSTLYVNFSYPVLTV